MGHKFNVFHKTVDRIVGERMKYIRSTYQNEFERTLNLIGLISLFDNHLSSAIDVENKPLDVILVDFKNNLYHLYSAGASIYSGTPFQAQMLMRTILETIVRDIRLIVLFEEGNRDFNKMYEWITQKNEPGNAERYNPNWKFSASRNYLYGNNPSNSLLMKLYSEWSEMIHGNSRIALNNVQLFTPDHILRSWDLLYILTLNVFMVAFYAFRDFLPLDRLYQKYVIELLTNYGLPDDIFFTSKLPDLNYDWLIRNLNA